MFARIPKSQGISQPKADQRRRIMAMIWMDFAKESHRQSGPTEPLGENDPPANRAFFRAAGCFLGEQGRM
jgi:hypothetical protein